MKRKYIRNFLKRILLAVCLALGILILAFPIAYAGRILPNTSIGAVSVGGLTRQAVQARLSGISEQIKQQGFIINIGGRFEKIPAEAINFEIDIDESIEGAMRRGRSGPVLYRIFSWIVSPFRHSVSVPIVEFGGGELRSQVDDLADIADKPRLDIRLKIQGTSVKTLLDTKPGLVIDRPLALLSITKRIEYLDTRPIEFVFQPDIPKASLDSVSLAEKQAERMMNKSITLEYDEGSFFISREQIGAWIVSSYEGEKLVPAVNNKAVGAFVANASSKVNRSARQSVLTIEDGRVSAFVPPHPGRAVKEDKIIAMILTELEERKKGTADSVKRVSVAQDTSMTVIQLPIKITKPAGDIPGNIQGISELIGRAVTPFAGSPPNRISNIKNGVKFLTGFIIQPGQEFSTLGSLGTIDNTTGYLPELVIKGDRTLPEFGGGLCQVSTTLFRAVMDAGLPITARRNHSYRVSYYERDGLGNYIGPGLDATIYEPDVDFKFRNDTANAVLIYGYVTGTKITFELYGTKDGRTSKIIGPKILTETPSGEPIYEETDTLAKGVTKQVEKPHPGGSATATYEITYSDGKKVSKEFKSWYRPWPARYLVGMGGATLTPDSAGLPQATPTP